MICTACGKANVRRRRVLRELRHPLVCSTCDQPGIWAGPGNGNGCAGAGSRHTEPGSCHARPGSRNAVQLSGATCRNASWGFDGPMGTVIAAMSMGEKVSGGGAVAAALGFFLPWVTVAGVASENGFDLAKASGSVYLTLLIALAAGALCYFSSKAAAGKKLMVAGYLVLIGGLGPPILLSLLFGSPLLTGAGIGLWLVGLGYTATAAGGLMTIRDFSKRTY